MLQLTNTNVWFALACVTVALLTLALGYLLLKARQTLSVQEDLRRRDAAQLESARQLQDSLLQTLHMLILRFHCAAASVNAKDPANVTIKGELQKADILLIEARTEVEQWSFALAKLSR